MADALTDRASHYDPRGLFEPDVDPPQTATVEAGKATLDAAELTIRQVNLELRRLIYEEGIGSTSPSATPARSTHSASASWPAVG
jgi:methylamine---glutamate N-methyltransferase subunit B